MLTTLIAAGCAAAMVAAAVLVVRLRHTRWMPSPLTGDERFRERLALTTSRAGGMLAGACIAGVLTIGAGLLVRPLGLLDAANRDFTLVGPAGLAVALCLGTLALFGATFGVLVDHLAVRWPRPGWSPSGLVSVFPFAALLPVPPVFVGAVISVLVRTLVWRRTSRTAIDATMPAGAAFPGSRGGRLLVLARGALGVASVTLAAGQILVL